MPVRTDLPELDDLIPTADVVDLKTATGTVTLRELIAGAVGYQPGWIKSLYAVRILFARLLRLDMAGMPPTDEIRPADVSFTPGDDLSFFKVIRGEEHHYLLLGMKDKHLTAYLAFIVADDTAPQRDFKIVTLVHFHQKTGRLYFAAIRPFHHVVVRAMIRAGLTRSAKVGQER
ncbi:DUF2867 domain-containing protein [Kribbella sancticallisti]|uniref:DUF2867 domain-containing protein n=1 Tax=Kribbella sancticallisti TaxID=460087 RepID=A0ABP4Q1P9_9ACTN